LFRESQEGRSLEKNESTATAVRQPSPSFREWFGSAPHLAKYDSKSRRHFLAASEVSGWRWQDSQFRRPHKVQRCICRRRPSERTNRLQSRDGNMEVCRPEPTCLWPTCPHARGMSGRTADRSSDQGLGLRAVLRY